MKRFLSLFLSLILVVTAVAGCGKEKEGDAQMTKPEGEEQPVQEEAVTGSIDAVIYDRDNDSAYWNAVVEAFENDNPGVKVDMYIGSDAAYELRDRILSGNSPDFVYLPSNEETGVTTALIKDKAMTDISDVAQVISNLMLSGAVDNIQCKPSGNEKTYLAPLFFETKGLIYNKTLLNKYGWSIPSTWSEFVALAQKCSDSGVPLFTYAGASPDEFVDIFAAALVPEVGTETVNKLLNCDPDTWDNENVKTFATYLEKMMKLVVTGSSTKTKDDVKDCLKKGTVVCISGTSEYYKELIGDNGEYEYVFASYPKLSGNGSNTSIVSFSEMYIPIEAKNPTLAKKFLVFQYGDTAVRLAAQNLGESTPVLKLSSVAAEYGFDKALANVYSSIGNNVFAAKFKEKAGANSTLADEFCSYCVSVFKGETTSDNFQEKMQEKIKDF